jgi:DNA-binding response OmpR family regulator
MEQAIALRRAQRILLVEEQAVSRDMMVLVLGRLNYQIETVNSAKAALERVRQTRFALVLISTTLPDMTGAELVTALRARSVDETVAVLVICPGAESPTRQACLAAGAFDALTRPIEIERLLRLVERATRETSARETKEDPVIDLDHLRGFTDGDPELEQELTALYLSSAAIYLERMEQALDAGQSWSTSAHALKGASANLGARRVATLAHAAEHTAPSRAQLETIRRSVDGVAAFFEQRSF